jgi:MFS family permease
MILAPKEAPRSLPFFYGWVLVAASFLIVSTYGVFWSYGLFFTPILNEFRWSHGITSTVFSTFLVAYTLTAPFMGWLSDRVGPRPPLWLGSLLIGLGLSLCSQVSSPWQLFVFYGIVAGMGHGAVYAVPIATLIRWFNNRRGLAVGLAATGIGVGTFILPRVIEPLIAFHGWRTTFLIIGLFFCALVALATIPMRQTPRDVGLRPYGESHGLDTGMQLGNEPGEGTAQVDLTLGETLRTKTFWLLYFSFVLSFGTETETLVHLVEFAKTRLHTTPELASWALSIIGITQIFGRVAGGLMCDRWASKRTLMFWFVVQTVALFSLPVVAGLNSLFASAAVLGVSFGAWGALTGPATGEFFGISHAGKIVGFFMTCGAVAGFVGPSLGGVIFDLTGDYVPVFLVAGTLCSAAVALMGVARPRPRTGKDEASGGKDST